MRECFGFGTIVRTPSGSWGATFRGMSNGPVELLPSLAGSPVPDLADYEGKVLELAGSLAAGPGTVRIAQLHLSDLLVPAETESQGYLHLTVDGNLGKAPVGGNDRVTASLAFITFPSDSGWLKLAAYSYLSIADQFLTLAQGTRVMATGRLESYRYNDKDQLQLSVLGLQLLAKGGNGKPPAPTSLMASRPPLDAAADLSADAFVAA